MAGDLFINGKDAYTHWGVSLDESGLGNLMAPAPLKDAIENTSRNEHGKRVIVSTKVESRTVTLGINITAKTEADFFARHSSFISELYNGVITIRTSRQPDVMYRMRYISCPQYSQYMRRIGKYSLRLEEMNPMDREVT